MRVRYSKGCPLCGCDVLDPFALDPWEEMRLHVSQVRCRDCRLLISQPQAGPEHMANYYENVHYDRVNVDPEKNFAANRNFYGDWDYPLACRLWRDWLPPGNGRALEVGCGYGGMLSVLVDKGFVVVGTEMSPRCAGFCRARGFTVVRGAAPGLPFLPETFDVVFSMHVVEHVADPLDFAKELVRLVRPGGVVVLATEDAWCAQYQWDRLWARLRGRLPPFRTSHDHTFVFLAEHLESLLRKAGCDEIGTRSYHVIAKESLHWKIYKGFFRAIDRLAGHGDYLMAVARRGSSAVTETSSAASCMPSGEPARQR